jgi:hypothetical protein
VEGSARECYTTSPGDLSTNVFHAWKPDWKMRAGYQIFLPGRFTLHHLYWNISYSTGIWSKLGKIDQLAKQRYAHALSMQREKKKGMQIDPFSPPSLFILP